MNDRVVRLVVHEVQQAYMSGGFAEYEPYTVCVLCGGGRQQANLILRAIYDALMPAYAESVRTYNMESLVLWCNDRVGQVHVQVLPAKLRTLRGVGGRVVIMVPPLSDEELLAESWTDVAQEYAYVSLVRAHYVVASAVVFLFNAEIGRAHV